MGAAASEAKLLLKTVAAFNWLLHGSVQGPELGRETAGARWLCKGSVQGPELGRKTVGETCTDAGASDRIVTSTCAHQITRLARTVTRASSRWRSSLS